MTSDRSGIAAWVQPQDILLNIDARDRDHVFELMAAAIGRTHGLEPAPIHRALSRREQAASTALGNGFAIPHARIGGLSVPLTLFMRTRTGIAFDAPDGRSVRDLLAIMVPVGGDKDDHLRLLALIAELFSDAKFRARLDAAPDATVAAEVFRSGVARVGASPA